MAVNLISAMSAVASTRETVTPLRALGRACRVRVRTLQAPIGASVQGTRMPTFGSQDGPASIGFGGQMAKVTQIHVTPTYQPTTVKLATTGATNGVVPGRTWNPPD
jgi:hypothetical protein